MNIANQSELQSTLETSTTASAAQVASLNDLLISKARSTIVIAAAILILATIIVSGSASTGLMARLFVLSAALGLASLVAHRMVARRYTLTLILWQVAVAALVVAASFAFGNAALLLLIAILPLLSAITLGWQAALVAELSVIVLVIGAQRAAALAPISAGHAGLIMLFGALTGMVGWTATAHLITVTRWALSSLDQARVNLDDAREQRLVLLQTQEDLTRANHELTRLAERLKALGQVAEEARQAKVEFVSNVSHELRTPLNMIIGFADIIAKSPHLYRTRLPAALMTDIAAIERNSQHLLSLVNDVLDLSQVESGRMAISRDWVAPQEMILAAVSVVQDLFESKGLYLTVDVPDTLPRVYCDQTRIRQVIINLLGNAGRFTAQGGVHVRAWQEQESLLVSVADTGPGIAEEDQKRIFEPFQQLDSSTRRVHGGSGLGLTISRQFIELHAGRMWLTSQPGAGTAFLFSLPMAPLPNENEAILAQSMRRGMIPGDDYGYSLRTRRSRVAATRPSPRLVVLEQEQSLQRLLARYVQDAEIVATRTPAEAAAALSRSPAKALVVNMPPFEDLTLGGAVLAPVGTPVISCWIPGEVSAASQLGVIQYLMKPITRTKLLGVLEDVAQQLPIPGGIKHVLVADDELDELHLFARMLESAPQKYQVAQVTDGKRVLEMLRTRKVDILLLDLMMPIMGGFQVLEEKQADPAIRDVPVIVISSRDPQGEAIASATIRLSHSGGFFTSHLLEIIDAVAEIVAPEHAHATPAENGS
mgnify:CR=1 FL=1|jgi:signal transduction histidine kinase/CheY-like chemotaxis protein